MCCIAPCSSEMSAPSEKKYALTVKNVVNALKRLTKWFKLGIELEIEPFQLEKIENDERNCVDQCMLKMVIYWLEKDDKASWRKLCNALEAMDETDISERIKRRYAPKILQELEEDDTKNRIDREDERFEQQQRQRQHEQQQREFERRRMEQELRDRMRPTDEDTVRKAFHEHGIQWVYDALLKYVADLVELQRLKDTLQAQVEEGNIFKERAKELKKRKEELCKRAQEFAQIEDFLSQDEKELNYQITRLQQLNRSQWTTYLMHECEHKLQSYQNSLQSCKKQSRICKETLEHSEFQLTECHDKFTSCVRELRCLQREYERCMTAVSDAKTAELCEMINKTLEDIAKGLVVGTVAGGAAGAVVAGVPSAAIGAAVGTTVIPLIGTAIGAAFGAVLGAVTGGTSRLIGGTLKILKSELSRFQNELMQFEDTRKEWQDVVEKAINDIDELEKMACALRDEDQTLERTGRVTS